MVVRYVVNGSAKSIHLEEAAQWVTHPVTMMQ